MIPKNTFLKYLEFFFYAFLLSYGIAELGLYFLSGLDCIYWHTHLMIFFYIAIFSKWILRKLFYNRDIILYNKIWSYLKILLVSIFTVEAFIIFFFDGISDGNRYPAYYNAKRDNYYQVWTQDHWLNSSEFSFYRTVNSLGFSDDEWKVPKKKGSFRVLCIGDSFTEGDGAHVDSSYVAFLRRELQKKYSNVDVFNAGVCGSDPYFYYINLKDRLLQFKPDVVIMTISSHDLFQDIRTRGGLARFQEDKSLKFNQPPWWEPLYAVSYVSRIFFSIAGYDQIMQKENPSLKEKEINELMNLYKTMDTMAHKNNFKFILACQTSLGELENFDHYVDKDVLNIYNASKQFNHIKPVLLKERYLTYMNNLHLKPKQLYWVNDGHHNAKGYEMMAKSLLPEVQIIIDSIRNTPVNN